MSDPRLEFILGELVLPTGQRVGESIADDAWIVDDFLSPVFEQDGQGRPRFHLAYMEMGRGSWKSGGLAAIALAECVLYPGTDIVIVAADADQARIDLDALDGYIRQNERLAALVKSRDRGDTRNVEGGSRVRVIAADAPGAWGLGGTHPRFRVMAEELSEWRSEELWAALASATGKAKDAQIVVASNAGFDKDRSWQWKIRETARTKDWGYLFAPPGPHASWISPQWIEQQRALLPPVAFDRVISNSWTSQSGDFVSGEQWRRCVQPGLHPNPRGKATRHFAGLDLGLTRDRTALAVVHLDPAQNVVLDELQVWEGSRDSPVEIAAVERAVLDTHWRFPGLRISADTWQLQSSIQRLKQAGLRIQEFTFSQSSMARLSAGLYEAISSASLHVYEDRELEAEILGLVVVETPSGWRFDHRRSGYSDRAIALAMALAEAVRLGRLPGGRTFSSFKQGARYPFTSRRRVEEPIVPPAGDALSERVGLPGYVGDQIQAHQPAWRQRQARRARARPGGG